MSVFFIEYQDGCYVNGNDIKLLMVKRAVVRFSMSEEGNEWADVCSKHASIFLNNFQVINDNIQSFQAIYEKQLLEEFKGGDV